MGGWNIGSGKLSWESVGARRDMEVEMFRDARILHNIHERKNMSPLIIIYQMVSSVFAEKKYSPASRCWHSTNIPRAR